MRFGIILASSAAFGTALAAPTSTNTCNLNSTSLLWGNCNILSCLGGLNGGIASCVLAVASEGRNLRADAECLASAVGTGLTMPSTCESCLDGLTSLVGGWSNFATSIYHQPPQLHILSTSFLPVGLALLSIVIQQVA